MEELKKFSDLNVKVNKPKVLSGQKQPLRYVLDKQITVYGFEIKPSKYPNKSENCLKMQYKHEDKMYVAFSIAKHLMQILQTLPEDAFPFTTTIINKNEIYEFT